VKAPVIAIHGKQDPVISVSSARELIAKVTSNSRLIEVDGDHVSILGEADVEAEEFFRLAVAP
jgi:pimeloyl-ACP methyl ester carboxylesterase